MNNEKYNQIIDEAYENYTNYPLATLRDENINILYQNIDKGWCMLIGFAFVPPHPTRHLTKEEFINKCKTDSEFSKTWELKIEERDLSYEERCKIVTGKDLPYSELDNSDKYKVDYMYEYNIPTKLITLTYNNETIEVYE